jgi:DNA-binding beta-propeller fold protein YncE
MGIDVDAEGNVFVVDDANDRIQKFTGDGGFLAKWGSLGNQNGQFNSPVDVALDADGNAFVSDQGHHMQKFACP